MVEVSSEPQEFVAKTNNHDLAEVPSLSHCKRASYNLVSHLQSRGGTLGVSVAVRIPSEW